MCGNNVEEEAKTFQIERLDGIWKSSELFWFGSEEKLLSAVTNKRWRLREKEREKCQLGVFRFVLGRCEKMSTRKEIYLLDKGMMEDIGRRAVTVTGKRHLTKLQII